MTTEKWQLYSQTGVDGPEYGVRIRTGYTVVGFQKEDAQAIVAWQNASIQPEGDIMEKAKALRNAALPRQTYSIPGQTGYGNPSLSKGWDFSAVDELVRVVVLELIAEVERLRSFRGRIARILGQSPSDCDDLLIVGLDSRIILAKRLTARIKELQDLIDKLPEEADWVADYHLLQSALDGPIIDAARKWHAAYRKAQNSNLMRAKEVERLRSVYLAYSRKHDENMLKVIARNKEQRARIKELEADRIAYRNLGSRIEDLETYIEQLEAAFLRSNAAMRYYQEGNRGPWPQVGEQFKEPYIQKARDALEELRHG